ncbi:MAG: tetratricopeptide repeat protein, partial [Ignavibacteria bacterium]
STVQALWHLSDLHWRRKDAAACLPLLKRITQDFFYTSFADRASMLIPEMDIAGKGGDFSEAIAHYTDRLREADSSVLPDSTDDGVLFYLASAYDKKGDRQKAAKYYSQYLHTNRTGDLAGRAFYALGILARLQGRAQAASSYFKEAAAIGGAASASRDIADLLYQTEQYSEAAKQYAQLAQSSDSAGAKQLYQSKVILATLRMNDVPEASKLIEAFEKSYGKDHPNRAEFEYERGLYYYRKEDYATARKFFKKVGDDYEDTRFGPWGRYYVAKILEVTNKLDEAAKSYENILTKYPASDVTPRILLSLGNMHFNAERFEDAIRYYQRITASPEKAGDILPYALNNLIEAYESTKLYDASLKTARDFIERYPNDESLIDKKIKIGTLSTKLGYYDQAILQSFATISGRRITIKETTNRRSSNS